MARNRMQRMWLPFDSGGSETSLAGSTLTRIQVNSQVIAEQGRDIDRFTIQRLVYNMYLETSAGLSVLMCALKAVHEDVTITSIDPSADQTADWPYLEEFMVGISDNSPSTHITRDIVTSRKVQGLEQILGFYIVNRDTVTTTFHVQGRVLALLP